MHQLLVDKFGALLETTGQ